MYGKKAMYILVHFLIREVIFESSFASLSCSKLGSVNAECARVFQLLSFIARKHWRSEIITGASDSIW